MTDSRPKVVVQATDLICGLQVGKRYSPPLVGGIWLWVYYNKIPIYPIFFLLKGDCERPGILSVDFLSAWRPIHFSTTSHAGETCKAGQLFCL